MTRALAIIPAVEPAYTKAQRLQAEAKAAAAEHVGLFVDQLARTGEYANEIANGGDVYAPALRERARRLVETLQAEIAGIERLPR